MNKIYEPAVALAIASILFSACSKTEENGGDEASQIHHITLNAGTAENDSDNISDGNSDKANGIETKAIFAADVTSNTPFYWQKTDKVGVFASGAEGIYPLTVKEIATDYKNATFEGNIKGTLGEYAVYPYNENHKISGNTLTYHLPSEYNLSYIAQDYYSSTTSSSLDSYLGNATPALLAKISDDSSNAEFKHLGGVLCIKITEWASNEAELTITADRQICGNFSVDLTSDSPQIMTTSEAKYDPNVAGEDNSITITGLSQAQTKGGVFFIPMPVGEYNLIIKFGFSKTGPNTPVHYHVSAQKSLTIARTNIKRASFSAKALHKNGYMLVNGHKFIDLGLSSGVLWAETNLEADLPADCGGYFAWGETASRTSGFNKDNYNVSSFEDAASKLWSSYCHVPTKAEFEELYNNTGYGETRQINSENNDVTGLMFSSKVTGNSNSIFIPINKYYLYDSIQYNYDRPCYWTSTQASSDKAYIFSYMGVAQSYEINKYIGLGIRPVVRQ